MHQGFHKGFASIGRFHNLIARECQCLAIQGTRVTIRIPDENPARTDWCCALTACLREPSIRAMVSTLRVQDDALSATRRK
jgi:hypothetical protein